MVGAKVNPVVVANRKPAQRGEPGFAVDRHADRRSASVLIPIYIFSLAMPIVLHAGDLRLSPYRLFLVLLFVPCVAKWLSGAAGRRRAPDILVLLFCMWAAFTLMVAHGFAKSWEASGILLIETFGSYIFARTYIRDVMSFRRMAQCLFLLVMMLLPFGFFEALTGRPILLELFGQAFDVLDYQPTHARHGLQRAQGPFEHPILFGIICTSAFGPAYYILGKNRRTPGQLLRPAMVATAVVATMSMGAFVAIGVQLLMILWDRFTRNVSRRWVKFAALVGATYVAVDLISNRTPFEVFITYFSFDPHSSWYRIHIWNYGTQSVADNPILGIGLSDWIRADWMHSSIDNFWLVIAIRYGLPGFLLLALAFITMCLSVGQLTRISEDNKACRTGLLVVMVGLAAAAITVHYWSASYSLFMFLMGSGLWLHDEEEGPQLARGRHARRPARQSVAVPLK